MVKRICTRITYESVGNAREYKHIEVTHEGISKKGKHNDQCRCDPHNNVYGSSRTRDA